MWEYKTQTLTKYQLLMTNGIFTIESDKDQFIQHNDYFEHKTFFQCPKCKSLNVESNRTYADDEPIYIHRCCIDCGHSNFTKLTKEDE